MLEEFLKFINEKHLVSPGQNVLLAVSGGLDSMVLLDLFEKSEFNFGIVHCNFKLRGEESDADEDFVKSRVLVHGVPSFFETFETEEYAQICGISIEMAARELRYNYFEQIRHENNFDCIATAHHQDDLIETFFLNLSRKTGIKGLTGIKEKNGHIIRPLLFTNRVEIEKYASENYIRFREDSSNSEVRFQRNYLRHKILPLFNHLNPSFKSNLLASIENLKDAGAVYTYFMQTENQKVVHTDAEHTIVDISKLQKTVFPKTLLFEILSAYSFNPVVINDVFNGLETESGKQYFSKTHRLVKDRKLLFISKRKEKEDRLYYIEADDIELFQPMDITIDKIDKTKFVLDRSHDVACIDLEKVEFPLLIRTWKQGDYFQPLGMKGFKKVSDFFIDQKIPIHEKENTWLLCSGKKVVWIMGCRLDERFKITPQTRQVLKIQIKK